MNFISVDSIVNEYISHAGTGQSLDRGQIMKYADHLVSKMPYVDRYVHKVVLEEVKDYRISTPAGLDKVIQVAYADAGVFRVGERCALVEWVRGSYHCGGCDVEITVKCDKCNKDKDCACPCPGVAVTVDADRLWELSHPECRYGHLAWYYRHGGIGGNYIPVSAFHPAFSVIGASGDPYLNADSHIRGCLNLSGACAGSRVKYRIDGDVIRFTAKGGYVIISYLSVPVDERGWRLIPDVPELIEAITWYIDERLSYKEYKRTREESYFRDYRNALERKEYFMRIARSKLLSQDFDEFYRDLGAFYGKYLPAQGINGDTVDLFHTVMSRISVK